MTNVSLFPTGIVDADALLEAAKNADLADVLIVGWDEGGELYFTSSVGQLKDISWLLENAQCTLREFIRDE